MGTGDEAGRLSGCVGPNAVMLWGLILCFLRVWGNGARRIGPIHTVYRDLELRCEDRRKLEQVASLTSRGWAERCNRTESAPEVYVGEQRTGC